MAEQDQEDQDGIYLGKKYNPYPDSSSVKEHVNAYLLNVLNFESSDNFSSVYQVDKNIEQIIDKLEVTLFSYNEKIINKESFNMHDDDTLFFIVKLKTFAFLCRINLDNISSCNLDPAFIHNWKDKKDYSYDLLQIYYTTNHFNMESCHAFDKLICFDSALQPQFIQKLYQYVRNMCNGRENDDMGDYTTSVKIVYKQVKDEDPEMNRVLHKLNYNEIKSQLDIIYDSSIDEDSFEKIKNEIGSEFENDETLKSFIKLMLTNVCFCIHHIYHPYNY